MDNSVVVVSKPKKIRKTDRSVLDATGIDLSTTASRENALLGAYKLKADRAKNAPPPQISLDPRLLSPLKKSYASVAGIQQVELMKKTSSPYRLAPETHEQRQRKPHHITPYERLSSEFTTNYNNRIHGTHIDGHSGDYFDNPIKVSKMLMNSSYSDLNIPGRAQDFSSSVEWRTQLRSNLN